MKPVDPRVAALCAEFDVEIIDGRAYPQPGQTRAVATIRRIIDRYGEAHARLVLSILAECKGNDALIDEVTLWSFSDLVRACPDLVEADASGFLELMDRIPIGPFIAIVNELSGIVPQRAALVGMLYLVARRMRGESLTGQEVGRHKIGRVNASEIDKGRPAYAADRRHRSVEDKAEIGRELLAKKASLPRGHFGPWLAESGLSIGTARACMRAARAAAGEDVDQAA